MKPISLLALLFALVLTSCSKKNTNTNPAAPDYFIYGYTGAFVDINTRTTYSKISNGEFRKDTSQLHYAVPEDISKFNFNVLLPSSAYEQVKDLPYSIPVELYSMNNMSIGVMMPDAGYKDVRVKQNGTSYRWKFEANQDASSPAIKTFVNRLQ
ncbi:MAG: hypothetical protein JWQ38_3458 [Flavipsychrobacter sp.]|nr:hypothetical protein [Flavipsychrobacter sp.]